MVIAISGIISFILDFFFGDPENILHPVVIMGRGINFLEEKLRRICPHTDKGELWAGRITAVAIPLVTFLLYYGVLALIYREMPVAAIVLNVYFGYQALAYRSLMKESRNVYNKLERGTIEEARAAVSRIVGRDTDKLTREGVIKAAVETVAESFSDGIIAPMFWFFIGGAPFAMAYKAINTMDSMIGYKNERYLYFGRAAARFDDVVNFIPSRIAAWLLIAACPLAGCNMNNAVYIWKRDRRRHASPNSAQTESVMAGALEVQLAGPAYYFGIYHEKEYIGDAHRRVAGIDIIRADKMVGIGSVIGVSLFAGVRILFYCIFFR